MPYPKLLTQPAFDGAVLRLVLDSPRGNVLDDEMVGSLRAAAADAAREPGLKALVFMGAGDHFSFGASVPEHRPDRIQEVLPRFHALFRDLLDLARPMIAVVHGNCLGGGLELAAVCNWIFASPDARFGLPEVKLGVFAPVGSLLLPWRVNSSAAEALCITGQILPAEDALDANLVDHLAEDPAAAADAWIEKNLLPQSAVALHYATRAARHSRRESFLRDLQALETLYLGDLMRTEDANEGIQAFLDKRPAQWRNR
jgi:cyclohexa-1,5-dienecarbonyl-CoA hydratase